MRQPVRQFFYRCSKTSTLICIKLFNVCNNKLNSLKEISIKNVDSENEKNSKKTHIGSVDVLEDFLFSKLRHFMFFLKRSL